MSSTSDKKKKNVPPRRQSGGDSGTKKNKAFVKEKEKEKEPEEDPNRNEDEHPLRIGAVIVVNKYVDGKPSERFADVIEKGEFKVQDEMIWRYYVHYHEFNRRMDEWIDIEHIVKLPSIAGAEFKALKEAKEVEKMAIDERSVEGGDEAGIRTRRRKRKGEADVPEEVPLAGMDHDEHEGMDEASLKEHEEVTKVKNVKFVELGRYRMETWYYSPFPKEYFQDGPTIDVLYFCESSMRFFKHKSELLRFQKKGVDRYPPGNEIYRDDRLAMFEVDGSEQKHYCQNLCYFAKLFLDHKTLYYDVDPFLFYVLCEFDDRGYHPVGYFSKEKYSDLGYNLACILTFPSHQRKGYGRFLINFSYELSKKEKKVGSPEKPLSDLGQVSYRSYWASTLLKAMLDEMPDLSQGVSIYELSQMTSILSDDIITALTWLGLLRYVGGAYIICATREILEELRIKYPIKPPVVDSTKIHWAPLVTDIKNDKWSFAAKEEEREKTIQQTF